MLGERPSRPENVEGELINIDHAYASGSLPDQVAAASRALAALGLVDAFGHVSARDGDHLVITPAADLATVEADACLRVSLDVTELPPRCPAEAWAHLALYRRSPSIGAVARAQPKSALATGLMTDRLLPTHGQACWLGDQVAVYPSALLIRDADKASALAEAMGDGSAVILRGNGAIVTATSPAAALATMYVLSATCDVWLRTSGAPEHPLSSAEVESWQVVKDELLPRLGAHLLRRPGAALRRADPAPS